MRSTPSANPGNGTPQAPSFRCDDRPHCRPQAVDCPVAGAVTCPGLASTTVTMPTPLSYNGYNHVGFMNSVDVCTACKPHGRDQKRDIVGTRATAARNSGSRAQLCKRCIREEMELYWQRYGTLQPAGPGAAATLQWIAAWPSGQAPNDLQDLCICEDRAITAYETTHCHACRDAAFNFLHTNEHHYQEHFLRERTKPVITGKKLCTRNRGTRRHRVRVRDVTARMARGIGRMCPCGEKPVILPPGRQWIDICLACMGVRVIPWLIPNKYSQANMPPQRNTRSTQFVSTTRGPFGAPRFWNWRVNIECGFRSGPTGDGYINGR